jgi:Domain of unknown function (DUF4277)
LGGYRPSTRHYSIERPDHLGVVAGIIKDLKIIELIDERLGTYESETLSAGETVASQLLPLFNNHMIFK